MSGVAAVRDHVERRGLALACHRLRADAPILRDTAVYSITDQEWPDVRILLTGEP